MRYTATFKCYPGLLSGQLLLGFLFVRYLLILRTHRIILMFDLRSVWYWRLLIYATFGLNPFNELYRHNMYNYKWKLIKVEKPNILNIFCGMSHHRLVVCMIFECMMHNLPCAYIHYLLKYIFPSVNIKIINMNHQNDNWPPSSCTHF